MSSGEINLKSVCLVYSIKTNDLSDAIYWKSLITLGEISWYIAACKSFFEGEIAIYVYLKCIPSIESSDCEWFCDVESKITLNSTKINQKAYVKSQPIITLKNCSNIIGGTFITWTDLMQYLQSELIVLDIQLSMSPVRLCRPLQIFHRQCTFRFAIDNISQLGKKFGPRMIVGGNKWTICVMKSGDYLGIFLRDKRDSTNKNWKWSAKCTFKLLSFNHCIKPHSFNVTHTFCFNGEEWGFPEFLGWVDLMNPENDIVRNDKAFFEIDLEVESPEPLWNIERWSEVSSVRAEEECLECSICYHSVIERQPVTTKCGHLFCSICIKQSVEKYKKCPNCNASVSLFDLRPIYLSP